MSQFMMPSHVFFGKHALWEAIPRMKQLGKRALIVSGPHISRSSMMDELKQVLIEAEITYSVFSEVTGEPDHLMVEAGVRCFREMGASFVIGIGGGSPLDTAKAIAAMAANPGKISDFAGKEIAGELPSIVAIPTTAGTGSEATKFTVITDSDTNVKMLLKGAALIPDLVILNPCYTVDMPKRVTAMTGLDALTHAVEAYTSKKAAPLTDMFAVSAVKRIFNHLPQAFENGFEDHAREQMALAAFEAGVCINNSSVTLVHGMSRPIGALFHVPHGMSNAMLLKECLEFACDGAVSRFADLGRSISDGEELGDDPQAAAYFLRRVEELCRICQIPSLEAYGIEKQDFLSCVDKMATDAIASGSPANTRKAVTREDCIQIYQRLLYLKE